MFSRLLFYPTLAYNLALEKVGLRRWYDKIDDTVVLGALPFRSMTKDLVEREKITGVVTMNESYELRFFCNTPQQWADVGVAHLHLPTPDLVASPTLPQIEEGVMFILNQRRQGGRVYVHCKAGKTRSATVVGAYLMRLYKWSPGEAEAFMISKRRQVWLRAPQRDALGLYFHQIRNMALKE